MIVSSGLSSGEVPSPSTTAISSSSFQVSTAAPETMILGSGLSSSEVPSPTSTTFQTPTTVIGMMSSYTTMADKSGFQIPSSPNTKTVSASSMATTAPDNSVPMLTSSQYSSSETLLSRTNTVSSLLTNGISSTDLTLSSNSTTAIGSESTKSVAIPTGKKTTPANNNGVCILLIAIVAGICGLLLVTLTCVIMAGLVFRRRSHSSKRKPKWLDTNTDGPYYIINPIYQPLCIGKGSSSTASGTPLTFNLYKDIDPDTLSMQVGSVSDEGTTDEGTVTNTRTSSTNISSRIESQTDTGYDGSTLQVDCETDFDCPEGLASSSAAFIVSEPITPLQFTGGQGSADEDDPFICGPNYPLPILPSEDITTPAEITSDSIEEIQEIGDGVFGKIVLARVNRLQMTPDSPDIASLVAVKKLKPRPSQKQQEAFEKEIEFLSQLKHSNVMHTLGVCYHNPTFVVMEYTEEGDLNQFLRNVSEIVAISSTDTQITVSTVISMASQIANGMKHLAALNFVHRDLATRNCLVGKNFAVKIADMGVNMQLYRQQYFRIKGNKLLPIRWMATECFSGRFSEKSDVWAFGVTMWELFTLAKDVPYPHLSDEEVIHNALTRVDRQFPSRPEVCPEPVYEIMKQCWIIDLQQRATFQQVNVMFQMLT